MIVSMGLMQLQKEQLSLYKEPVVLFQIILLVHTEIG